MHTWSDDQRVPSKESSNGTNDTPPSISIQIYILNKKVWKRFQNLFASFAFIITHPQVQKLPDIAYQIYQTLQIYWVYEKDYIKYKYDRKWKTENMAEKHNFQE